MKGIGITFKFYCIFIRNIFVKQYCILGPSMSYDSFRFNSRIYRNKNPFCNAILLLNTRHHRLSYNITALFTCHCRLHPMTLNTYSKKTIVYNLTLHYRCQGWYPTRSTGSGSAVARMMIAVVPLLSPCRSLLRRGSTIPVPLGRATRVSRCSVHIFENTTFLISKL